MAKKSKPGTLFPTTPREHIEQLIEWMAQGVYEKESIIAIALLCAVAGENMFILGPPGTAKSMVASRLKMVFKEGKSFDYLMSRFSTPDEIFGPISISHLKNDDKYERLTSGYLPESDVVFLDEIWKAGPSIQNTLLTVINEHIFHNGGQHMRVPMKVLIAASNELPAKDEGLEALWDRFLMRMVSNCIENDAAFFKMLKSEQSELKPLPEQLYITQELYDKWQSESRTVTMSENVVAAIKSLRKLLSTFEKEDGNQLRYYVSDRRWRKAYRLMQTSAYLNGRSEINLTDYLLLIHSFWNDDECIPNVLNAFTSSLSDSVMKSLNKIDKAIRQIMAPQAQQDHQNGQVQTTSRVSDMNEFAEYDYFYYLVENHPEGETFFSKWDYTALGNHPKDGVRYFDSKRNKYIIHALMPGRPFDAATRNASNLSKVRIQKCNNGVIINGTPYSFRKRSNESISPALMRKHPVYQLISAIQESYKTCVAEWEAQIAENWVDCDNIFLSPNDLSLIKKMIKEVSEQMKTIEVKLNNVVMMIK